MNDGWIGIILAIITTISVFLFLYISYKIAYHKRYKCPFCGSRKIKPLTISVTNFEYSCDECKKKFDIAPLI